MAGLHLPVWGTTRHNGASRSERPCPGHAERGAALLIQDSTTAVSMAELLRARAAEMPHRLGFLFLERGVDEGPRWSYGELDRQARRIAAKLRRHAAPADRALLVCPPGLAFIAAFFGCQAAGMVPVPVYPPRLAIDHASWSTLVKIARDCRPSVLLTTADLAPLLRGPRERPPFGNVPIVATDDGENEDDLDDVLVPVDPEAPALLQYTSGSTAAPRGVVISHRNLLHNERMIQEAFEHSGTGVGVSWLPPYHDMGLIGGILQVVYHGASCVLLSPLDFLRKPSCWLQAISRYRADTSGAPGFAFDHCVDRISPEDRASLTLDSWSVAAVGSEPVRPRTLERFTATFAPHGFRRSAFYPCYGLAEATLFVTGGHKSAGPVVRDFDRRALEEGRAELAAGHGEVRRLVGCGGPWLDQEVCIVEPDTRRGSPDCVVGEVWVAGPSVAQGYWNDAARTELTFRARRSDTDGGPYLRTGDLGFLMGGELFLTGRIKDVLIVRGRNHDPQDIEATAQSVHAALRSGAGAAFEVEREGGSVVVLVQEVDRRARGVEPRGLIADIREAVAQHHSLQLADIRLLEPGSIPKTSSGKVQRHRCRAAYEQDTLRPWRESAR